MSDPPSHKPPVPPASIAPVGTPSADVPSSERPTQPPPHRRSSQRLNAVSGERSVLAQVREELLAGLREAVLRSADTFVAMSRKVVDDSLHKVRNEYYGVGKEQGRADFAAVFAAYTAIATAKCASAQLRADPRREPVDAPVYASEVRAEMVRRGTVAFSEAELETICRDAGIPLAPEPGAG